MFAVTPLQILRSFNFAFDSTVKSRLTELAVSRSPGIVCTLHIYINEYHFDARCLYTLRCNGHYLLILVLITLQLVCIDVILESLSSLYDVATPHQSRTTIDNIKEHLYFGMYMQSFTMPQSLHVKRGTKYKLQQRDLISRNFVASFNFTSNRHQEKFSQCQTQFII